MRILVLQLQRIGDVILTTPLLAGLRKSSPGCSITIAIDESTAALAPALDVERAVVFRKGFAGHGFWRELAAGRFDVCLDVTGNDRSASAAALSGARRRITWSRFAGKPLRRLAFTEFVDSSVKGRHTADHHTDLLRALGVELENVPLDLRLPQAARDEAANALAGIAMPFAVVHAGTTRAEKYWLPERWAEVIAFIRSELGLPVVLTGSSDASERRHLDAIQRAALEPCLDLAGKLSLLGSAAVIERARLLCAVDSAPVHFADALGTPLVALFGPTNPFHWRPRRATSRIVAAAGEGQELAPGYPKAPMSGIAVSSVVAAVRSLS